MAQPAIAEIVTFRLKDGATTDAFLEAMGIMQPFIKRNGGMLGQTLPCDTNGLWTDHILWEREERAKALAAAFMTAQETEAARAMIDGPTVRMRHATVLLSQDESS